MASTPQRSKVTASRLADRRQPGDTSYTPLVTSLVSACARDILRFHGQADPPQRPNLAM